MSIVLDGKYEFPGARLGTVTLGAAGGSGPVTAVLVKGNAIHLPEHIPFLDSDVEAEAPAGAAPGPVRAKGGDTFDGIVGHPAAAVADGDARSRQVVYYGRDNRRLELRQVQSDGGRAVEVTVGHWRMTKSILCQSRLIGEAAQVCFKVDPLAGALHLVPNGKTGQAQTLTALPESGARMVAQD